MTELQLVYRPVGWAYDNRFDRNAKLHDIGALIQSISKHGFRVPVVWDETLSAVIAGNGRVEAVYKMEQDAYDVPAGIRVIDSQWHLPVIYGISAANRESALAFLIDDNNLTMLGGDFTAVDMARAWEGSYLDLLQEALPYTVSADNVDLTLLQELAQLNRDNPLDLREYAEPPAADNQLDTYFLRVPFTDEAQRDEVKEYLTQAAGQQGVSIADYLYSICS